MRRQKVKKKETRAVVPVDTKKSAKKRETPQFHYIKNCVHNLKGKSCPMCKLIERETSDWLRDEAEKSNTVKMHNFFRRAEMRYGLLRDWSKNQLSWNADVLLTHSAEIILCASAVEALSHAENVEADLRDLHKSLLKRNRVLEVGDYAATYIQCRLRGMSCRRRVRDFMLRRFEYYPETNRRAAYFLDRRKGDRWYALPAFIGTTRPTTPRTVQRRISYETNIRDRRLDAYRRLENNPAYTGVLSGGLWKAQETTMRAMRQIVILHDVIHSIMRTLVTKRRNNGERPTVRHVPNPDYKGPPTRSTGGATGGEEGGEDEGDEGEGIRSTATRKGRGRGRGVNSSTTSTPSSTIEQSGFPFWFTLSNPAPPTRQIYLSLALETEPLLQEDVVVLSPEEEKARKDAEAATAMSAVQTGVDPAEDTSSTDMDINHRLQLLDRRAWDQMMCMDANEMVLKIAKAEEIAPAMSSCVQIAEDEHHVWTGTLVDDNHEEDDPFSVGGAEAKHTFSATAGTHVVLRSMSSSLETRSSPKTPLNRLHTIGHTPAGVQLLSSDGDDEEAQADEMHLDEGLFLPCQIIIHPYYAHRSPVGMFRMFFIDGVCLAICHTSPWVYYSEVRGV